VRISNRVFNFKDEFAFRKSCKMFFFIQTERDCNMTEKGEIPNFLGEIITDPTGSGIVPAFFRLQLCDLPCLESKFIIGS